VLFMLFMLFNSPSQPISPLFHEGAQNFELTIFVVGGAFSGVAGKGLVTPGMRSIGTDLINRVAATECRLWRAGEPRFGDRDHT
jgi:hypothetical protein